jgi:hypothetical protein
MIFLFFATSQNIPYVFKIIVSNKFQELSGG